MALGLGAFPLPAGAQDTGPTNAAAEASTNQVADASYRDPFWPVGYEKPKPKEVKEVEQKKIEAVKAVIVWPKIKVKGITKTSSGQYMAILEEHGFVSPGDILKIRSQGILYRLKIDAISESDLSYHKLDATPPGSKPIIFGSENDKDGSGAKAPQK